MNVGQKIRALRTEAGVTLPDLAEKSGVSKGFLSQLENDEKANVSLDTLAKVAKALGISIGALLGLDATRAKQATPEAVDPGLEKYVQERQDAGRPIPPDVLRSLCSLKERRGVAKKSKADWAFLCDSIERIHLKK
ncbi:MAG: helix-turn-helix transcriptional regulator [Verrucomicrobia bacterium]|nr:helix-turn-helix transcriptional regulator [Verrucomicrobiota bacterium]